MSLFRTKPFSKIMAEAEVQDKDTLNELWEQEVWWLSCVTHNPI